MPGPRTLGRGLFYTRDSGGKHETTPREYVLWARRAAAHRGVAFTGSPEQIEAMIRDGRSRVGDLFLDYGVTGDRLSRAGLDALFQAALADPGVSHVFIPRRDRFARPSDPIDAISLENVLRTAGLTLVYTDRVCPPLERGQRRDIGDVITAMVDYNAAGEFRGELAEKMIRAQLTLAKAGFATGGRPPYGFRRWLARSDGTPVRQLTDGESVRKEGHHVLWLPGPEEELAVIGRIVAMLETMPASRVAAALTAEGVPTPDAGRMRTDGGVRHPTSGVWHQQTVVNIARNPLLVATATYGRRSMGDQRRFTPDGPRPLADADVRPDGRPKVVFNAPEGQVTAPARFEPLTDPARHGQLLRTLDARAGTQRGKPRGRDPARNPLGGRVFDLGCAWPMYRQPYGGRFRYLCGLYQQSHGAACRHNWVDGVAATRFLLACVRQRVAAPADRAKLEEKLRAIARRELGPGGSNEALAVQRGELAAVRRQKETAGRNMALATSPEQLRAMQGVFDELVQREEAVAQAVGRRSRRPGRGSTPTPRWARPWRRWTG
jgi:hypothetical protein